MMNTITAVGLSAVLSMINLTVPPTQTADEIDIPVQDPSSQTAMEQTAMKQNAVSNSATQDALSAAASGSYWVEAGNGVSKFVNAAQGYSVQIPTEMQVKDMTFTSLRSVLADSHRQLEIYRQPTSSVSAASYLNYSYKGLNNPVDHIMEYQKTFTINGRKTTVRQWYRPKLARVENDRNYYASVDVVSGGYIYNFFFTSDLPFWQCGGYMDIVSSFRTFAPTVAPYDKVFHQTANAAWNQETREWYQTYFSDQSPLTWGIFEPSAPIYTANLIEKEQKLGYKFPVVLLYTNVLPTYDPNLMGNGLKNAYAEGRAVELTLQTTTATADGGNMVYDVLNGEYDTFLKAYAADIAAFGHPVLFRLGNEMNGDWCPYSSYNTSRDPGIYVEFYRYVHQIFKESGALANTVWVWNPNEKSFPDFTWNSELSYYPGDDCVDVVGLTGYNTGNYYAGETWRSFSQIYDPIYNRMAFRSQKPLMITEFASSSVGGDKAAWVQDMFQRLPSYPKIKMAIWWDGRDLAANGEIARPYFIDQPEEIIQIFRENLSKS